MQKQRFIKIYCLTFPSGKQYVGQTIRKLEVRLKEHTKRKDCLIVHNALKKYGIQNVNIEVLQETLSLENADILEKEYIKNFKTLYPNGYNIKTGGSKGSHHCQESIDRMRESKLGPKNHNYGKPRTEEAKKNISLSKRGKNHHFYGEKLSHTHRLNLSKSRKKDDLPMYLTRVKARPAPHYSGAGYCVSNHPFLKQKSFTSKKLSDEEKYKLAIEYLNQSN